MKQIVAAAVSVYAEQRAFHQPHAPKASRIVLIVSAKGHRCPAYFLDRGRLRVQEVVHDDQVVLPAVGVLARSGAFPVVMRTS